MENNEEKGSWKNVPINIFRIYYFPIIFMAITTFCLFGIPYMMDNTDFGKEVKSSFREATGRSLKTKDVGGSDNIELIQSTARSARKTAYYRFHRTFEIA